MTDRGDAGGAVDRVLAELWRRERAVPGGGAPHAANDAANDAVDEAAADAGAAAAVQMLSQRFGEQAMDCVSATIRGDRPALVRGSADLVELLFALWAEAGLEPREVWTELHKREQLGTLLMQLNQAQNQLPRRVLKPWRVDSTKLP